MSSVLNAVPSRAYSVEQLAAAWGVSVPHLKNLIHDGRLPVFRVGRRMLIPLAVVEQVERGEVVL